MTDVKRGGRPGGRPPDPEADRRILAAAQKLIAEEGFSGMAIEGVAAESGVAKTTIYRRYRDKADLATAAIADLLPLAVPDSTGNAYDDLVTQLDFNRRVIDLGLPGALLAEERRTPELLEAFRERVVRPRIELFRELLRAGIERGELRPDLDLDAATDLVLGSFFIRYIADGRPQEDWPRRVAETVWPALKA